MSGVSWIEPNWPESTGVGAAFSLRHSGFSSAPFDSLNLGSHVGDDPQAVASNRQALSDALKLPARPLWLRQTHGIQVVEIGQAQNGVQADAVYSVGAGQVCAVMVADCLPILLRDTNANVVAAIHAGWRGLAAGVIENCVQTIAGMSPPEQLEAWLGPCIGPTAFEVGVEVKAAFMNQDVHAQCAFKPARAGGFYADLQSLARRRLLRAGVSAIWASPRCTYSETEHFFSYRRDKDTGRMAALIWIR